MKIGLDEVLDAFRTSSRIALINTGDGLVALNTVKELMADRGRPHDNLYEAALWADMLCVQGDELFYAYMVDNQAIVIPETIDAIRAADRNGENGERVDRQDERCTRYRHIADVTESTNERDLTGTFAAPS